MTGSGGAQPHQGLIKHRAAVGDSMGFEAGLDGAGPDAADKLEAFLLPEVEVAVALVVAVHHPSLAGRQEARTWGINCKTSH